MRVRAWLGSGAVLAVLTPVLFSLPMHLGDHSIFWYAGRIVLSGASAYDNGQWFRAAADFPAIARMVALYPTRIWAYPPWVAYLFVPEALLPLEAGVLFQQVLYLVLGTVASIAIARSMHWRTAFAPAFALALIFAFAPFVHSIRGGEHGPIMLAGIALVLWGLRRPSALAIGLGMLLVLTKPHITYAFTLFVALELIDRRAWRVAATSSIAFVVPATLAFLANPDAASAMLLGGADRLPLADANATTWSLASAIAPNAWPAVGVFLVAVISAACLFAIRTAPPDLRRWVTIASSLILSVATAPYANPYDHYLLLVPLVVAIALADRGVGGARLVQFGVAVVVAGALPWAAFLLGFGAGNFATTGLLPIIFALLLAASAVVARGDRATSRPSIGASLRGTT